MGGDQIHRLTILKEEYMRYVHFQMWNDSWKCQHCNKIEENRYHAREHFKKKHGHKFDNVDPTYGESWCTVCAIKKSPRTIRSTSK